MRRLIASAFILLFALPGALPVAQAADCKVYWTEYQGEAAYKIYITEYSGEEKNAAILTGCKVTRYQGEATYKLYITKYSGEADIKITQANLPKP